MSRWNWRRIFAIPVYVVITELRFEFEVDGEDGFHIYKRNVNKLAGIYDTRKEAMKVMIREREQDGFYFTSIQRYYGSWHKGSIA